MTTSHRSRVASTSWDRRYEIVLLSFSLSVYFFSVSAAGQPTFSRVVIDADNPADPHCKTLGDIDGDGLLDAIVASSAGDGMFWYEYPSWTKHPIRESGSWTTDMQAGDVDGDGDLDIVVPNGSGLQWYENPRPGGDPRTAAWTDHLIGTAGANNHDVELGDVDDDGDLDAVSRRKNGNGTFFWRQGAGGGFTQVTISTLDGEGIALGDIDGDGDIDVAQNAAWVEQVDADTWIDRDMGFPWPDDVGVVIIDVDEDGRQDIVLGPSESTGRLSWFESDDPVNGPWTEHPIDPSVSFLHTFKAADMDFDGDVDLVTAEMHQSSNPDEVSVYRNRGRGLSWEQLDVASTGSHNVRVGDIGGDNDLDIFGANWNDSAPNSAVIEMWENQSTPLPLDAWRRHIVETALPWRAVFVDGRDLDGDGLPDLVTGGWWYPNPGTLGGTWTRTAIGAGLENLAAVHDFDHDGDLDVLGTDGQPTGADLAWARNDGGGTFAILDISSEVASGDFLQGVSVAQVIAGGGEEVVLSWHNGAGGTSLLSVPADPATPDWPLAPASATTNQEQVPVGDLDGDGDLDIHLGDQWLRQDPGGIFTTRPGVTITGGGVPDRIVLADLDGDDDLDAVIGVEFAQQLLWAENQSDGATWVEHLIATDFDYFSVDVGDLDRDGDPDVVGGAHQGAGEVRIYENDGAGGTWTPYVVDAGDSTAIDHHDGTRLVDMDRDGDLDVISIGWTRRSLVVYENLAVQTGDTTAPTLESVLALGDPNQVIVSFSEALDAASAEDPSNYAISDGVTVSAAALGGSGRSVVLTTSTLGEGISYTLTVNNVADPAGNAIMPNTRGSFVFVPGNPGAGLVAHWPFDAGAGLTAVDVSGNGHHGTLTNGPLWTADPALAFDGVDDHVSVGTFDVVGDAITIAAWIRPLDLANCSASDCRIVSKATGTAENAHVFMLSTIASGGDVRLRFRLETDGVTDTLIANAGNLPTDQWVHAAATWDGTTMRIYQDGVDVGGAAKGGVLSADPGVPVWIGGNPSGATDKPWSGLIDDVRIYDRALAAEEILALPGPGSAALFADGFESGDTSAWSEALP